MQTYKIMTLAVAFVFGSFIFSAADVQAAASAGGGAGGGSFSFGERVTLGESESFVHEDTGIEFTLKKQKRNAVKLQAKGSFEKNAKVTRGYDGTFIFHDADSTDRVSVVYMDDALSGESVLSFRTLSGEECEPVVYTQQAQSKEVCVGGDMLITFDENDINVEMRNINKKVVKLTFHDEASGVTKKRKVKVGVQKVFALTSTKSVAVNYDVTDGTPSIRYQVFNPQTDIYVSQFVIVSATSEDILVDSITVDIDGDAEVPFEHVELFPNGGVITVSPIEEDIVFQNDLSEDSDTPNEYTVYVTVGDTGSETIQIPIDGIGSVSTLSGVSVQ